MDAIYTPICMADKLICAFEQQYFGVREETFYEDEEARFNFAWNYEYMLAQLWSISQLVLDIRVKLEFALGIDSATTRAHIANENGMLNMHKDTWVKYIKDERIEITD